MTLMLSPCALMISLTMARPSPVRPCHENDRGTYKIVQNQLLILFFSECRSVFDSPETRILLLFLGGFNPIFTSGENSIVLSSRLYKNLQRFSPDPPPPASPWIGHDQLQTDFPAAAGSIKSLLSMDHPVDVNSLF